MNSVGQLWAKKEIQVWPIQKDATVFDTLKQPEEKETGACAPVEGDKSVDRMAKKDYARKIMLLFFLVFTGFLYLASITLLTATILPAIMPWLS